MIRGSWRTRLAAIADVRILSDIVNNFLRIAIQGATMAKKTNKTLSAEHELLIVYNTPCKRNLVLERDEWKILSSCILKRNLRYF